MLMNLTRVSATRLGVSWGEASRRSSARVISSEVHPEVHGNVYQMQQVIQGASLPVRTHEDDVCSMPHRHRECRSENHQRRVNVKYSATELKPLS